MKSLKIINQNVNSKLKTGKKFAFLLAIFTFNISLLTFNLNKVSAANSSNDNYNLEISDIDTSPQTPANAAPAAESKERLDADQDIGGIISISQTSPLTFSLDSGLIDFGILSPGNPVTRTATFSILSSSIEYQVIAYANHPLQGQNNEVIPDITCDNGSCTEINEAIWENHLTYGFGFRCDSNIDFLCLGFSRGNYYKQFADLSRNEQPQIVAVGRKNDRKKQAQLTFKLNASGTQKSGSYANNITLIAAPSY